MQKIQLKAEYHNLLCRASNKEAQKAKPLSLTIFPTLSTVLQFSLACAVALQIRKSWTDSNKRQLSNSEGQLSQTSNFLRFVHTEHDKSHNKCSRSTHTEISPSSAHPPSPRATPVSPNKFWQFQVALMSHRSLQRITSLSRDLCSKVDKPKVHKQRLSRLWPPVQPPQKVFLLLRLLWPAIKGNQLRKKQRKRAARLLRVNYTTQVRKMDTRNPVRGRALSKGRFRGSCLM